MRLVHGLRESEGVGLDTVNITDRTVQSSCDFGACHSGIRLGADGRLYRIQNNGGFSSISGQWTVSGSPSTFYVQRTILTGTLEVDAGAGWLQLNVDRDYDNIQSSAGTKIASILIELSDDVSGVPLLDAATFNFISDQGFL